MKIMKVLAWPPSLGEHFKWRETCVFSGDVIVEEYSMLDSHGPKRRISLFRPMNACMQHHRPSHSSDHTDGRLCLSVVMMGANTSKGCYLLEVAELFRVGFRGKACAVVTLVLADRHSKVAAVGFKLFFAGQSLMGVEVRLESDIDKVGVMIHQEQTTGVGVLVLHRASCVETTTFGRADEVVFGDNLARMLSIVGDRAGLVFDGGDQSFMMRNAPTSLLSILTCSTHGVLSRMSSLGVKISSSLGVA